MIRIPFIDAPSQQLSIVANGHRADVSLLYNRVAEHWTMGLVSDVGSFSGRRVVKDTNLVPKRYHRTLGGIIACNDAGGEDIPRTRLC